MSTRFKKLNRQAQLWVIVWTAGLVLGIFILILRLFRGLRVRNRKGLLHKGPTLIVANHPAIWETVILPGLFFPNYLLNSSLVPWSTPDKKNFDRWHLAWARPVCIFMARDNGRELVLGIKEIVETLQRGETVILFPEGGRTRSIRGGEEYLRSSKGKRIRPLKQGALARIRKVQGLTIVPVWIERPDDNREEVRGLPDRWRRMTVLVGDPILLDQKMNEEVLAHLLEQKLLELTDQVP